MDRSTISLRADATIWVDAEQFEWLVGQARQDEEPGPRLREASALYQGVYLPDDDAPWSADRRDALRRTWRDLQLVLARHAEQRGDGEAAMDALHRALADDASYEPAGQALTRLELRRGRPASARVVRDRLMRAIEDRGLSPDNETLELERELNGVRLKPLPTGTLTFLMTDVEGSTALWEEAPEAMHRALAYHDETIEDMVGAHGGESVRSRGEGDSLFAVFNSPVEAVIAALAIQTTMAATDWPTPRPIAVRMGLHTGDTQLRADAYYGSVVNRCARLRNIGHGGQILISQVTYDLVHEHLPSDTQVINLGEHRLRHFSGLDRIFQVMGPGLRSDFPPFRVSEVKPGVPHASALPVVPSLLIGRERELRDCISLLLDADVRLLTLSGPPGTGKTRLALEMARKVSSRFRDGVSFVSLSSVGNPDLVIPAIGHALGLQEGGSRPMSDILRDHLQDMDLLLVLDNFEHVLSASVYIAGLLASSPRLKVLATSRAPLHVRAEREYPVPPLDVPDEGALLRPDDLAQCSAMALFIERATAVSPEFVLTEANSAVCAEICRRLDGLPLAIELAAARIKLLPPHAMIARLGRRLPLLVGGARDLPARQQTLRGAIAWSYDLLDGADQTLFRHLSVLVGGWTVPMAAAIGAGGPAAETDVFEGVASLLDKSLVRRGLTTGAEPRFRMLATLREYGLEQLEAHGEGPEIRDRLVDYCLELAEEGDAGLIGAEQVAWCNSLEAEHDNLRASLTWVAEALSAGVVPTTGLVRASSHLEAGIRLADALEQFWMLRGHVRENWPYILQLLAHVPERSALRAAILVVAASAANCLVDLRAAATWADEAIAIWRELRNPRGLATALARRGVIGMAQGEHALAESWLTESRLLFHETGGEQRSGIEHPIASFLAQAVQGQGDHAGANALYDEALHEARARKDEHAAAYALRHMGRFHLAYGRLDQAAACVREGLPALLDLQDRRCTPASLETLAFSIGKRDRPLDAVRLFAAATAIRDATGMPLSSLNDAQQVHEHDALATRVGQDAFAAGWADGRAMGMSEAIAFAMPVSRNEASGVKS